MAYIESSYKQLLFGVSQQDYKDRLDGQLEEQINMVSDLTFNLRRRAPLKFKSFTGISNPASYTSHYHTTIARKRVSLVVESDLDAGTGYLWILDEEGNVLDTIQNQYIYATADNLRYTTLGDEVYIANIAQSPWAAPADVGHALLDPDTHGYFYISSGQFGKTYRVSITDRDTNQTRTASWTTPDGSQAGHAAQTTPESIANRLVTAMMGVPGIGPTDIETHIDGAYVFLRSLSYNMTVSSDSGSNYIQTSLAGVVRDVGSLPARLPDGADGLIIGVGTSKTATYYRWDNARQAWLEDAGYHAYEQPSNMPVRLRYEPDTDNWVLEEPAWERRAAGDEETNPTPQFLKNNRITGIGSFQGRLVLLANDFVCMSASNNPLRFFRSTVASLQPDDPIEVASTASQAAPYEWVTAFNRDLVIWANSYQSIIPGSQAITPGNVSLSVVGQYDAQLDTQPVPTGRSVFFASSRSDGYSGIWEAIPSEYTDSQFIAADVTSHIPRYVDGTIRFIAASSTSSIAAIGYTGDPKTLLIHEYLWSGQEKIHHSWHKWTFAWDIQYAWFIGDQLHMYLVIDDELVYTILDLRIGAGDTAATVGRLDLFYEIEAASDGSVDIPAKLVSAWGEIWAVKTSGENPYTHQRITVNTDGLKAHELEPGATYVLGCKYRSSIIPTAPSARDSNGVPITTARAFLHKWVVTLQNTGEFTYTTWDKYREPTVTQTSPLLFASPELGIGKPLVASGQQYIPARLDMPSSRLEIATDDVYDLNITSLEYGFRYHQRYGRRQ